MKIDKTRESELAWEAQEAAAHEDLVLFFVFMNMIVAKLTISLNLKEFL